MKKIFGQKVRSLHIFYLLLAVVFLFATYVVIPTLIFLPRDASATGSSGLGTGIPILGWLWSDNIGWISANCQTGGPTGNNICGSYSYGLAIDPNDGTVSGMGWSDHVGWISANTGDLAGCPSAPCSAVMNGANLVGWLRFISGTSALSGGWDGFVQLDGVSLGSGTFTGYAWSADGATVSGAKDMNGSTIPGSVQVRGPGWISFANATTLYNSCTASTSYTCFDPQTLVRRDQGMSCGITYATTTCPLPQYCSAGSPVCLWPQPNDIGTGTLTGKLTVKPSLIPKNATTTVYWSLGNVQPGTCRVTNTANATTWTGEFSATSSCPTKFSANGTTGCVSSAITDSTTFTLTCNRLDGTSYSETATVNILPDFQER